MFNIEIPAGYLKDLKTNGKDKRSSKMRICVKSYIEILVIYKLGGVIGI